jgi:CHAD domain-containing protein
MTQKNRDSRADFSTRHAACCFLRQQVDALMEHLEESRTGKDIETIHKSRVACRRMRAGMKFYADCYESGQLKKWQKEIRRLLNTLGRARDLDVQLVFLDKMIDSLGPEQKKIKPGIKRMELRWQQKRHKVQPEVNEAIDHILASQVLVDIHLVTERTLFQMRHQTPSEDTAGLFGLATDHVHKRVRQLLGLKDALDEEEDTAGHHRLRMAAKKLRYTLELCDAFFPEQSKPFIQTLKQLQHVLGDLHDCDVWIEMIEVFIRREHRFTVEYFGHARPFGRLLCGLEYLESQRQQERAERYQQSRAFFEQLCADGFWDQILDFFTGKEKNLPPQTPELPSDQ